MSRLRSHPAFLLATAVLAITPVGRAETPPASPAPTPPTPPAAETKAAPALNRSRVLSIAFADESNAVPFAARLGYVLDATVRQSKRFDVVDAAARFDPTGAQERAEASQKGADALNFGIKAYQELQDGLGLEWFDRAINAYKESALWEKENIRGYTQAALMRIVVKWSDDPNTTRREITNLLAVDPKAELPKDLSPAPPQDLAQEFQRIRDSLAQSQPTNVEAAARPVAARVYVDGVYKGTTPIGIQKVVVGEHLVSVVAPGYEPAQRAIRITPGETISEDLRMTDKGRQLAVIVERIRQDWGKPGELEAEKKLAALADADEVMLARVSREAGQIEISVHRYRASDGHHSGCADLPPQADSDQQLLHNTAAGVGLSLLVDAPLCDGRPCACRATFTSPNLPAVIATGVSAAVLLAGGITLSVIAKIKADSFAKLPQTQPDLTAKGNEVRAFAIPADICTGLGLVSAGVWGYLAFGTSYARHSDIRGGIDNQAAPPPKNKSEDDPFGQLETPSVQPGYAFSVTPQPGGVALSLSGEF